ncbi:hypothetical protein A5721_22975 [Mycobacterium vulneris]|nr:hypothetical protein A5721_22975 [Mycolicibacterium vulneris]
MPAINSIKQSPDKTRVAIRTQFGDTTPGPVKSWLASSGLGFSEYLAEADVADWVDLYTAPEPAT